MIGRTWWELVERYATGCSSRDYDSVEKDFVATVNEYAVELSETRKRELQIIHGIAGGIAALMTWAAARFMFKRNGIMVAAPMGFAAYASLIAHVPGLKVLSLAGLPPPVGPEVWSLLNERHLELLDRMHKEGNKFKLHTGPRIAPQPFFEPDSPAISGSQGADDQQQPSSEQKTSDQGTDAMPSMPDMPQLDLEWDNASADASPHASDTEDRQQRPLRRRRARSADRQKTQDANSLGDDHFDDRWRDK